MVMDNFAEKVLAPSPAHAHPVPTSMPFQCLFWQDYNCTCYDGYLGKDCQEDINECESSPCQYNGTCLERSKPSTYQTVPSLGNFAFAKAAGYYCDCIPGITGLLFLFFKWGKKK